MFDEQECGGEEADEEEEAAFDDDGGSALEIVIHWNGGGDPLAKVAEEKSATFVGVARYSEVHSPAMASRRR